MPECTCQGQHNFHCAAHGHPLGQTKADLSYSDQVEVAREAFADYEYNARELARLKGSRLPVYQHHIDHYEKPMEEAKEALLSALDSLSSDVQSSDEVPENSSKTQPTHTQDGRPILYGHENLPHQSPALDKVLDYDPAADKAAGGLIDQTINSIDETQKQVTDDWREAEKRKGHNA